MRGTWTLVAFLSLTGAFALAASSCGPVPGKSIPCGNTTCTGGQVCCNASCGICTDPGMFCTQQACGGPGTASCSKDSDCQAVSNYCGGCNCDPLLQGASLPVCTQGQVVCFADPCMNRSAYCESGTGRCKLR